MWSVVNTKAETQVQYLVNTEAAVGLTGRQAPVDDCTLQSSDLDLPADGVDVVLAEADDAVSRPQVVQGLQRVVQDGERRQALVRVDLSGEAETVECILTSAGHGESCEL